MENSMGDSATVIVHVRKIRKKTDQIFTIPILRWFGEQVTDWNLGNVTDKIRRDFPICN